MFLDTYSIEKINIEQRRYIGNKNKLKEWIMGLIFENCPDCNSFIDIFSGTGVIAKEAINHYDKIIINDFLYSNNTIYKAFFGTGKVNHKLLVDTINNYNNINSNYLKNNYFSDNFGDKFFNNKDATKIGYIREDIERKKSLYSEKEYNILLASIINSMDKIANTVGHYDAYIKKEIKNKDFKYQLINYYSYDKVDIYKEDANILIEKIEGDILYVDPPYNSRQYSRFYHIYENLVKWGKPELYGVAKKPLPENMSDYCRTSAKDAFKHLIENANSKYIVVSYNNTYNSKSSSSENKITYEQLFSILSAKGKTKVFESKYKAFNTGKTDFADHKELLFITKNDD
jgi:adenine-specific DNA-methyltransferase